MIRLTGSSFQKKTIRSEKRIGWFICIVKFTKLTFLVNPLAWGYFHTWLHNGEATQEERQEKYPINAH